MPEMPDETLASLDYYGLLQVDVRAETEVIQAAYRVLARRAHPDRSGDEGRMKLLNEAWHILGDPARRARYDRVRGTRTAAAVRRAAAEEPVLAGRRPEAATSPATQSGSTASVGQDSAGPPPGKPWGSVLSFGRYAGWSLGEIFRVDREFLEWLQRAPAGTRYRSEIEALLRDG